MGCYWRELPLCWNIGHVHMDMSSGWWELRVGNAVCSAASLLVSFLLITPMFYLDCKVLVVFAHDWQLGSKEGHPCFKVNTGKQSIIKVWVIQKNELHITSERQNGWMSVTLDWTRVPRGQCDTRRKNLTLGGSKREQGGGEFWAIRIFFSEKVFKVTEFILHWHDYIFCHQLKWGLTR